MKIGASTLAGIKDNLETSLEFIEGLGIRYAEIVHQYPNEFLNKDILDSYNLKYSIHAPFIDVNIASIQKRSRINSIDQIKSSVDLACEIGAEAVVVHPGLIPFIARQFEDKVYNIAKQSINEIGVYSGEVGVLTTIENMPAFDTMIYQNINDLHELLVSLDMYMTLDIGHANHVGYGAGEVYFDSIKHIHIHDNLGDDDAHLPLGEGTIDLKSIVNTFEKKFFLKNFSKNA